MKTNSEKNGHFQQIDCPKGWIDEEGHFTSLAREQTLELLDVGAGVCFFLQMSPIVGSGLMAYSVERPAISTVLATRRSMSVNNNGLDLEYNITDGIRSHDYSTCEIEAVWLNGDTKWLNLQIPAVFEKETMEGCVGISYQAFVSQLRNYLGGETKVGAALIKYHTLINFLNNNKVHFRKGNVPMLNTIKYDIINEYDKVSLDQMENWLYQLRERLLVLP